MCNKNFKNFKNFKFEQFINNLEKKSVCFFGLGVSHFETIKMLAQRKIDISVRDKKNIEQIDVNIINNLKNWGVKLIFGENYLNDVQEDVIFRTPGMNLNHPVFDILKNKAIVTSEMEAFFETCPCKIIGITGSDGKTTTSTLISEILKTAGFTVHLGGNIGRPLFPIVESINPDDIAVVELSSFQLVSMRRSPNISVVTNISPNHLDVHKDFDEYINAKKNIFSHQSSFDKTILNCDDKICQDFSSKTSASVNWFGPQNNNLNLYGAFINNSNDIYLKSKDSEIFLFNSKEIKLPGKHNVENFLAAIAATQGFADKSIYLKVANTFSGVEHRIEFVREINNVKWFNDSIATSPTRTIAGLKSFDQNQKIILIAGGYDKKISYQPLAPHILEKVSVLILTGDTSDAIYQSVVSHPNYSKTKIEIQKVSDLKCAVDIAFKKSSAGDVVFFSPASASFDFFKNFEERGRFFKTLVSNL